VKLRGREGEEEGWSMWRYELGERRGMVSSVLHHTIKLYCKVKY